MLLISPLFALVVFARQHLVPAILAAVIVPYLFLPEAFKIPLPGLPDLTKTSVISVGLLLGLLFYGPKTRPTAQITDLKRSNRTFAILLTTCVVLMVLGACLTVLNNREVLRFGPTFLPAMRPWDVVGFVGNMVLSLIPFFVARSLIATPTAHRQMLKAVVYGGLAYAVLMLVEIRLSPQLHNWVYGFHQHSFIQHIRDGYRPMVFLEHGLWVGFYTFTALIAAAALWQSERQGKWLWATGILFVILMISENLGAFALGLFVIGLVFLLRGRLQILAAAVIALSTLFYPGLRQAQMVPIDGILSVAESVSAERAGSLRFRLDNEDLLLARAFEKPLTGWGGWARDRIYDGDGRDIAISEGRWILTLGQWGWIGYVALFGLLTLPLIFLTTTGRRKKIPPETVALALIGAGNLIYMIPNATLTPVGLLIFGALAGFVQNDPVVTAAQAQTSDQSNRRNTGRYTRFPPSPEAS